MTKQHDLVLALGGQRMVADALKINPSAVSMALKRGDMPSSWFIVMKGLADARGIDCPMCLFSFIQNASSRPDEQNRDAITASPKQPHSNPAIVRSHGGT